MQGSQSQHPFGIAVERPDASLTSRQDAAIVRLSGELDLNAMIGKDSTHSCAGDDTALAKALRDALPNPPALVIIELSSVTYLSSLAMSALLGFQKDIEKAGGQMRLAGLVDTLAALIHRCRLDGTFHIFRDVDAALRA